MISAIRNRIIHNAPAAQTAEELMRDRYEKRNQWEKQVEEANLIPASSGAPPKIYGQHLETVDEGEGGDTKKREKGVWYVPWYDNEDTLDAESIYAIALTSMEEATASLGDPSYVWDVEKKAGVKSRENYSKYMRAVGVGMWQEKKMGEDDILFPTVRHNKRDSKHMVTGGERGGRGGERGGRGVRGRPRGSRGKKNGVDISRGVRGLI
ncbi:MAG: hypothetical protein JKX97_09255 [Candidatus Lindowbacteria bacterium]|nr:hypothetical protein [Candidatus Lindowbacteria bacterium]